MKFNKAQTIEMEKLDQVSGGTHAEYKEIFHAALGFDIVNNDAANKVSRRFRSNYGLHFVSGSGVAVSKNNIVKANSVSILGKAKTNSSAVLKGTPAEYTCMKTGKALTHGEVLGRVKALARKWAA